MLKTKPKFVVIDVDGTMTDAGIYYDEHGNELKKFCTRDAAAFFAAKKAGIEIVVLTGRECKATERRMKELKVSRLIQGVKDKYSFLNNFIESNNLQSDAIGYIGDDLNDYAPMNLAGYRACPADSCKEIIAISDFVSSKKGGEGVIRDVFEKSLLEEEWDGLIMQIYNSGI